MILYQDDHILRAGNLARVLNERSMSVTAAVAAVPACADSTLTIWGHGGPDSFADKTAPDLRGLIAAWKTRNPQLATVELITCDARHAEADRDSYTDKLMPLLIVGSKSLVAVKALPRGGSKATWSVLRAVEAAGSNGYYFIAGETEPAMNQGAKVLTEAEAQVPASTAIADRFMAAFPIAKAVNDRAAMSKALGYVCSSGSFSQLRARLVQVTTYSQNGKIYAVPGV
ncbi:MAG: hypothetical protein JWP58_544 [Hymenobacter sp.]|nr:hypothetical protein [Hymenobacter sp.]